MTTGDPLYWGLILIVGVPAGLLACLFDRQRKQLGVPDILMSVAGAVVGAHFVGPVLQIAANFFRSPTAEIQWPGPISMQPIFLIVGTAAGAILANIIDRHLSKGR